MDPATKSALLEMEKRIVDTVREDIKEAMREFGVSLRETYDLKIKYTDEKADRALDQSKQHYLAIAAVHKRMDSLEARQSRDEGKEVGEDKATAAAEAKKIFAWTAGGVLITAAITILIFLLGG